MSASFALCATGVFLLAFALWIFFKKPRDQHRHVDPSWIVASLMSGMIGMSCLLGSVAVLL